MSQKVSAYSGNASTLGGAKLVLGKIMSTLGKNVFVPGKIVFVSIEIVIMPGQRSSRMVGHPHHLTLWPASPFTMACIHYNPSTPTRNLFVAIATYPCPLQKVRILKMRSMHA